MKREIFLISITIRLYSITVLKFQNWNLSTVKTIKVIIYLEILANLLKVLFASGVLNLEPVDDSPNTTTTSSEQLANTQASITEIESVNTQRAAEDRKQQRCHRALELQHREIVEGVLIHMSQSLLDYWHLIYREVVFV